jgi:hypothetical protein
LRYPLVALFLLAYSGSAHAQFGSEPKQYELKAFAFMQPQLNWQQQDGNVTVAQPRQSGFALRRARAGFRGHWATRWVTLFGAVEAEMTPQFSLLDAFIGAMGDLPGHGFWQVEIGQTFAPFDRQSTTLAWKFQMVDQAALVQLSPQRQIGGTVTFGVPYAPWLQLTGGVYNGEGINVLENVDDKVMWVARLAFRPLGYRVPFSESAFGPTQVYLAGYFLHNVRDRGDYDETNISAGGDAFFAWNGLSGYASYLWGQFEYPAGAPKQNYDYHGATLQAGYLLPLPGRWFRKFEVAFRFEAIAPNRVVPLESAGDATQARASYIAGISYYHREHWIKVQANYYHNQELDDRDRNGLPATYENDAIYLQLTYRLE